MDILKPGQTLPETSCFCIADGQHSAANLRGRALVVYFYPRDDTPGCTTEGKDFAASYAAFVAAGCEVIGVSRDSPASHRKFSNKFGFPFPLASDEDEQLCRLFDVIKPKNMYGKTYMGIERSTFVLDALGVLRHEWRKVKVPGHVAEVLDAVTAL